MAHQYMSSTPFRSTFKVLHKEVIQWFPGHMGKGLKQMEQKLKAVDCVIEVHDARIPFSGRNTEFKYTISGIKPHILVLNKKDLTEMRYGNYIKDRLKEQENIQHVLYTNCRDQKCSGIKNLMPLAQELILNSNRFNRSNEKEYCIMIIGVPNVGKSSIVNILRNRHLNKKGASQVGAEAGITRSVLNRIKICQDPLVYLLDTPGILAPNIGDTETGMKLALCSSFQDHLVGVEVIADYLLYWLNKNNNFKYVEFMGLKNPTDDIGEVLSVCAMKLNKTKLIRNFDGMLLRRPDLSGAADLMIKAFRTGKFGKVLLDKNCIQ